MNSMKPLSRIINGEEFSFINQKRLIFMLLFLINYSTMAQWTVQSPVPTYLDIRGIGATDAQHVFLVTSDNSFDNGGSLFESVDGGTNWIQRDIPISLGEPFNGLFFLDNQNGWAFGNDNYSTSDGGVTWTQLPFLGSTYFMEFYTPNIGLASGNFGQYISRNGGLLWEPSPNQITAFDFSDNLNGLGVSIDGIYKTSDGGNTFAQVSTGESKDVVYLTSVLAAAIKDDVFLQSADSGATWTVISSAGGKSNLLQVSNQVALAWGRTGTFPDYDDRIFRTSDGGLTWVDLGEVINADTYSAPFSFTVINEQIIVASDGAGNMYRSTDAGLIWAQTFTAPAGLQPSFFSNAAPVFADIQTGYFGYGTGFVIKSTNGGASWFQISSGSGQTLNDIDRFTNGNMIAVGDMGTILLNDGISSQWRLQPAITPSDIKAVQVTGANEVVVVDKSGRVFRSGDGGSNWIAADSILSELTSAEDIHFTSLLEGWVIGSGFGGSALFHTNDGGNSWNSITDFQGAYIAVDKEGENMWAANVTGRYYRSTDNGSSWVEGDLPGFPFQINDMDFFNSNIGYAVGSGGQAFRSSDGGNSWQILPTPNQNDQLTDLYIIGANEFWVSTNSDVAYYSANGGQTWSLMTIGSAGFGSFSAITANPAGDAWTAGFQGYIEHFSGPPPPALNQPPTASFQTQANGLSVSFTDNSTDIDGTIVSWAWLFGDGTNSSEQNPVHTYDTANTYIVRLTVKDNNNDSASTIRIIAVQPNPGGVFGNFTEVTPLDSIFVTPENEDFWVITTAPADYDSDGDLDMAVLGYYVVYNQSVEDRLVMLVNNGELSPTQWNFASIDISFAPLISGSSDMAWGDADGDGDQDLAIGTDGVTVIYRNDGGTLVLTDTELPGYYEDNSQAEFDLKSITWADFDNDGDLDILIPSVYVDSSFSFNTVLMRNDGQNGTGGMLFTRLDSIFASTTHASSIWADYDNDQDLDLLLVNIAPLTDEGFIRRYRNDGNGIFTGEDILGSLTIEHGDVQWGDYDADGDLDILVAGNIKESTGEYTTVLRLYTNNNETYEAVDVISCAFCVGWFDFTAVTWADYDSDGDIDILLAGTYNSGSQIEGRAQIYTNNGSGVFTGSDNQLPAPRASGDRGGTFQWLDMDGDGDLDYFIAGEYFVPGGNGLVEAQMHAYRNDAPGLNAAPAAPASLNSAGQNNGAVLLSWAASTDDHTPSAALTYDLDLFRDGIPVSLPIRLPEPGDVSSATEWLLTNLPDGQYTWTVRAVDGSYFGSPFATGEFTIGAVSLKEMNAELPVAYAVEQNYPNPFNPSTVLRYALPFESNVTLTIYNIIGQKVTDLVNELQPAGYYEVNFIAENLPSSIYIYTLDAKSSDGTKTFKTTKKMMLLK